MADMMLDADVVIAGGGLTGLSLSLSLAHADAAETLTIVLVSREPLDRASGPADDARAFSLSAGCVQLLECLGVWPALKEFAQPVNEILVTDKSPGNFSRDSVLHFSNETPPGEPGAFIVESFRLLAALREAVLREGRIEVIAVQAAGDFKVDENTVTVTLDGGGALRARLLLAADGRASGLRSVARIKTVDWSASQSGIVATIAHEKPHGGRAVQYFLAPGPFAMLPLPERRISLVWTEEKEKAREIAALGDEKFLAEAARRIGDGLGDLKLAGPRGVFPLSMLVAREFVRPRFALVGDAAHGMHWIAGQGLNYGLRDVAAMAEVLVDAQRLGLDIGALDVLERYERWRRFDSVAFTAAMAGLNSLFSNDHPGLRLLRGFGLGVVEGLPALKKFFVLEAAGISGDVPKLMRGERV